MSSSAGSATRRYRRRAGGDKPDAERFDFERIRRFHITQYDASDRSR